MGVPSGLKESTEARKLIARILSDIMDRSGLTNAEIAKKVGLSPQYLYKVRSAKYNITIDVIGSICEACHTPLSEWIDKQSPFGANRSTHADLERILQYGGGPALAARISIAGWLTVIDEERQESKASKE